MQPAVTKSRAKSPFYTIYFDLCISKFGLKKGFEMAPYTFGRSLINQICERLTKTYILIIYF